MAGPDLELKAGTRRLVPAGMLHWRRWDEEMVVYDPASASTHLLSPAASEVLQTLLEARGALDAQALAALLFPEGDKTQRQADAQALEPLLHELAGLGLLVEAAP